MAEIEIRIRLAIDAASQSAVLPIYVVSTPKTLDERVTFAQSSQPSQAAKAKPKNRHVRALKQPLVAAAEKKHPHRTGLNAPKLEKPQCCLARQVGKYDRRKAESVRWGEGEDCYRSACRRCRRRCSGNGNVEQPPQWVGYTQRHSPRGLGWNC